MKASAGTWEGEITHIGATGVEISEPSADGWKAVVFIRRVNADVLIAGSSLTVSLQQGGVPFTRRVGFGSAHGSGLPAADRLAIARDAPARRGGGGPAAALHRSHRCGGRSMSPRWPSRSHSERRAIASAMGRPPGASTSPGSRLWRGCRCRSSMASPSTSFPGPQRLRRRAPRRSRPLRPTHLRARSRPSHTGGLNL